MAEIIKYKKTKKGQLNYMKLQFILKRIRKNLKNFNLIL